MNELLTAIRDAVGLDGPLDADTPLLSSGLVDSFGVVLLVTALEDRYGIALDEIDIGVDNFDTPRQILKFI